MNHFRVFFLCTPIPHTVCQGENNYTALVEHVFNATIFMSQEALAYVNHSLIFSEYIPNGM